MLNDVSLKIDYLYKHIYYDYKYLEAKVTLKSLHFVIDMHPKLIGWANMTKSLSGASSTQLQEIIELNIILKTYMFDLHKDSTDISVVYNLINAYKSRNSLNKLNKDFVNEMYKKCGLMSLKNYCDSDVMNTLYAPTDNEREITVSLFWFPTPEYIIIETVLGEGRYVKIINSISLREVSTIKLLNDTWKILPVITSDEGRLNEFQLICLTKARIYSVDIDNLYHIYASFSKDVLNDCFIMSCSRTLIVFDSCVSIFDLIENCMKKSYEIEGLISVHTNLSHRYTFIKEYEKLNCNFVIVVLTKEFIETFKFDSIGDELISIDKVSHTESICSFMFNQIYMLNNKVKSSFENDQQPAKLVQFGVAYKSKLIMRTIYKNHSHLPLSQDILEASVVLKNAAYETQLLFIDFFGEYVLLERSDKQKKRIFYIIG